MRTLKKTLSLVLVLALALGLFGAASATSFTDTKSSNYGEAVNVLTGIGVINGTTATTFDPTGSLTREQAAKIITYMMLGSTNAALLSGASSSSYSDVAQDRWSAGYIQYCTNLGILAGNGDGTFNPTGVLTSCAWAKMLLCALGYKADLEGFTGSSWAINAAAKAVTAGINDSTIALSSTTSIDREKACQMAFKTLTATEVSYSTSGTTITVGGATVVTGASAATPVAKTGTLNYNGAASTDAAYTTTQFCEGHFSTLKLSNSVTTNAFGRPADTWTFGASNATIAQAASTPVLTYTTSFYPNTAYKALINAGYTISSTTTVPVYVNGYENTAAEVVGSTLITNMTNAASTTTKDALSGNGVSYEYYVDSNNVLSAIVIVNTALYKVTAYKADDTTTATVDERTLTLTNTLTGGTYTAYAANDTASGYVAATGFDSIYSTAVAGLTSGTEVDVLGVPQMTDLTTPSLQLLSIALPTTASGALSSYTTNSSLTVGGKVYKNAATNGLAASGLLTSANVTAGINVTVVLDAYGYAVGMKATTTASNYAYVLNTTSVTSDSAFTNQAKLLLNDGSIVVATLSADPTTTMVNKVVTYSVNTSGVYTLTAISTNVAKTAAPSLAVTTGASAMTMPAGTVYANSNTIFLVATASSSGYTYASYKGIANVPSYVGTASAPATYVAYGMDPTYTTIADVVYIQDAVSAGVTTSTGTYIFKDSSTASTDSTGTYYTYNAVVGGSITTVKVNSTVSAALSAGGNLLSSVTYTSGIVTAYSTTFSASTTGTSLTGTGLTMATNGVIGLTGNGYNGYSSSAVVFYATKLADGSYTISTSSISAVSTDTNDTYKALLNTSGVLTALYVVSVA